MSHSAGLRTAGYKRQLHHSFKGLMAAFTLVILLAGLPDLILGQDQLAGPEKEQLGRVTKALPGDLMIQLRAVGQRLIVPGKEETVLGGQLIGFGSPKSVSVVHQLSGIVRVEGIHGEIPLTFDGDKTSGLSSPSDALVLESFVMDTLEGLVYGARTGAAVRLLGRGFGPDPRIEPKYKGPRYDIYEVFAPVRTRPDRPIRMRRYYFDSSTGLLTSTRYADASFSPPLKVETRFSNWQQISGSAYPGLIERYENGNVAFSFVVSTASSHPRQDAMNSR